MRLSTIVRLVLSLSLLPTHTAFAGDVSPKSPDNVTSEEICLAEVDNPVIEAVDEYFKAFGRSQSRAARMEARKLNDDMTKLEDRILQLREMINYWDSTANVDKRLKAEQLILRVMLNQVGTASAQFGPAFKRAIREYVSYKSAEAWVNKLTKDLAADPKNQVHMKDLEEETADMEVAKDRFLEAMGKAASLGLVLEVMREKGVLPNTASMFQGSSKALTDRNGNAIVITKKQESAAVLESTPAPRALVAKAVESADPTTEGVQPQAKPAVQPQDPPAEAAPAPVRKAVSEAPTIDVPAEKMAKIKKNAIILEEKFLSSFEEDENQKLVAAAREAGVEIEKPTLETLQDLYDHLIPSYKSTKAQKERNLRLKRELWGIRFRSWGYSKESMEALAVWVEAASTYKLGFLKKAFLPITRLLDLKRDTIVARRHLGTILQLTYSLSGQARIDELMRHDGETTDSPRGEVIITYIRYLLTENRGQWKEILGDLDKDADSLDASVKEQLMTYKAQAVKDGPLNLMGNGVDRLGSVVRFGQAAVGAAGVGYASYYLGLLHFLHLASQ